MSYRYYETLTTGPDFSEGIQQGIVDERDPLQRGQGAGFVAWPGKSARTFQLRFQTFAPEEWKALREFADRHGGRAKAFFLPSWTQDLELAEDAIPGTTIIKVAGHRLSDTLVDERPDTIGRRLLIRNQSGSTSTHWVHEVTADGPNDTLVLDAPIPNGLEAGRCLISFCYLCRFLDDNLESIHLSPSHAGATWAFREANQRRVLNQTEVATGTQIETLKATVDVIASDEDPIEQAPYTSACRGPIAISSPQTANYVTEWVAALNRITNTVTLTGGTGYSAPTDLYNAPAPANQIALAFDALSRPILAWEVDGTTTIARMEGLDITRLSFTGYSPCAFNTFSIDSTVDAGTATVAVFYLKPNDTTIYCRIGVESFATEHRYCNSPLAPIYLHGARIFESRLELYGMDAWHRRARWRSEVYIEPIPPMIPTITIDEIGGELLAVTVVIEGTETPPTTIDEIGGAYASIRVLEATEPETSTTTIDEVGGSYDYVPPPNILTPAGPDTQTVSINSVAGNYFLSAIRNLPFDTSQSTSIESIQGSYG